MGNDVTVDSPLVYSREGRQKTPPSQGYQQLKYHSLICQESVYGPNSSREQVGMQDEKEREVLVAGGAQPHAYHRRVAERVSQAAPRSCLLFSWLSVLKVVVIFDPQKKEVLL
jgi:hypothetical protein